MSLQDLTPQLRTRLSRMERTVGWFILLAASVLAAGFIYYITVLAERKGWFTPKVTYETSVHNAAGLKVGDPVKLMGFDVGQILRIVPNKPGDYYGVTVQFRIKKPYYGYLWTDSVVKVGTADLLGQRYLELTKGVAGVPTLDEEEDKDPEAILRQDYFLAVQKQVGADMIRTNEESADAAVFLPEEFESEVLQEMNRLVTANQSAFYTNIQPETIYWLEPTESPALGERLERVANAVEKALPNFLALTNSLNRVLTNSTRMVANADEVLQNLRPASSNLALISANLANPTGSLGEWLIPTQLNQQLSGTLTSATGALDTAQTNLSLVASNLVLSLENLASMTSNLNAQVQANSNMLGSISEAVIHADQLVQGLKQHWLLRSAFRVKATNAPPASPASPLRSPKDQP